MRNGIMKFHRVRSLVFAALVSVAYSGWSEPLDLGASTFVTTADDVRIHCLEKGSGPAILFVPGWMMPAEIWEHQILHFSKTHRVVAMDPRSQGRSSNPPDGHFPAVRARDIKAVIDTLKLKPVLLVGWSIAVTEMVSYADQFGTAGITGFVFVDGIVGSDYDPLSSPEILRQISAFQRDRQVATIQFVRSLFKRPQSEDYLKNLTFACLKTPTNSAMALFLGAFTTDNRYALAKINRPTLIVTAGKGPLLATFLDMERRIPGSRLEVFNDAGHALFVDEPERFNTLLTDFMRRR